MTVNMKMLNERKKNWKEEKQRRVQRTKFATMNFDFIYLYNKGITRNALS